MFRDHCFDIKGRDRRARAAAFTPNRGIMKVIVADKISDRGIELLKQTNWNIVFTTKDNLNAELADADPLIVRSATKVTAALLDHAPRFGLAGAAGVAVGTVDGDDA